MGAKLLLIGRDKTRLKKLLLDISITGDVHSFGIADLLQPESINKVIEEFILKSGPVSGFIHSAGIEITTPLAFLKKEQFNQIFSVNFLSGIDLAKIISKKGNFTTEGASFVFISSILSISPKSNTLYYAASKGAINAAMRTLATDLASKKIRVNAVLPSVVLTELVKNLFKQLPEETVSNRIKNHLLGLGRPEDVAYACTYLLSDAARWVTGTELVVDGGYNCK
jgi:NAD(P)-dependent dehydrogenase (short-subunit alcohol dehydrogenase family)